MAKKIRQEKEELRKVARHRLLGAITIVLVVIVFLPMVLDQSPRPLSDDIRISIPEPPDINEGYLERYEGSNDQKIMVTDKLDTKSKLNTQDDHHNNNNTVQSARDVEDKKSYCVQLGVFQGRDSVDKLVGKVKNINLPVYTEVIDINGKPRTRVRIGPYTDRKSAQVVIKRIEKLKLKIGEPVVLLLSGKPS